MHDADGAEVQTMLQVFDIRGSRIYQEAKEEGLKEGMEKGVAIARLAAEKKPVAEIAAILEVDVELVRQVLAQVDRD
jgi:predicted transposase YdaD